MKINVLYIVIGVLLLVGSNSKMTYAQGWVGNGGNHISVYNSSLSAAPINVGIGTSTPTAQLHTTGSIRHENLLQANNIDQVLVTDVQGNVFWRDATTLGGTKNAWLLNGNSLTNPDINFLGTTDNNRLVIRTNNIERMTILPDGRIGVNNNSPSARFVVNSLIPDNHVRVQGVAPSIIFEGSPGLNNEGRIGYATQNNNFVIGSIPGDLIVQTLSATANLIFGTTGGGTGNGVERARITAAGFLGVATQSPTATLHTNGTVRFQNLPTGSGNALVMDANGNVFRSTILTGRPDDVIGELRKEIDILKSEIEGLKSLINFQQTSINNPDPRNSTDAILYQNIPNPFNETTLIRYYLPESAKPAILQVSDLSGKVLQTFNLKGTGEQHLSINAERFSPGTYIYTLIVGNRKKDSKKMVLTK